MAISPALHKVGTSMLFLLFLLSLTLGCTDSRVDVVTTCRSIGLCDHPRPTPVMVDVVCDASLGSSCTAATSERVISSIVKFAAMRPGSSIRIWMLGLGFSDTTLVASRDVEAPTKSGSKALTNNQLRFSQAAEPYFLKALEKYFEHPEKKRSPIAEGISKVALTNNLKDAEHIVICITDGREVSEFGDFECKRLPQISDFLKSLHNKSVLLPGSFSNSRVFFVAVTGDAIQGRNCAVNIARELEIRKLWQKALVAAGAKQVVFASTTEFSELEDL